MEKVDRIKGARADYFVIDDSVYDYIPVKKPERKQRRIRYPEPYRKRKGSSDERIDALRGTKMWPALRWSRQSFDFMPASLLARQDRARNGVGRPPHVNRARALVDLPEIPYY